MKSRYYSFVAKMLPGRKWTPNPTFALTAERGNLELLPTKVGTANRKVGLRRCEYRRWEEANAMGHAVDIGFNITEHESVQTSHWSLIAREIGEQIL